MTEYPILTDKEALEVTTEIMIKISEVEPPVKMFEAFHAWQATVSSITMSINSGRSIKMVDDEMDSLISGKDEAGINALLDLRSKFVADKEDAEYNYQCYRKILFDLGVEI